MDLPALKRHLRPALIALNIISALSFSWLSLICLRVLPLIRWQLYASSVAGASCGYAAVPLAFEYASELAYPAPEGVVGAFLAVLNNAFVCIFLCLFFIPFGDLSWMSCVLAAASAVPAPMLMSVRNRYGRLEQDNGPANNGEYGVLDNQAVA